MKEPVFIIYGTENFKFGKVQVPIGKPLILFNEVGASLGLVNGQTVTEEMYNTALSANLLFGRTFCQSKLTPQRIDE